MKLSATVAAFIVSLVFTGCYAGSQFTIEATHLEQPVSMTSAIHNADMQVLTPKEYEELGRFSVQFSGWSFGSPVSPNPHKDISDELNEIVKEKGGNGITQLSIRASNHPLNFVSAFVRGMSILGIIGGLGSMAAKDAKIGESAGVVVLSAACFLFAPTIGEFTVKGMVVRMKEKPDQ
jgi:hypothetical protein